MLYADDAGILSRPSKGLERMMTVIVTACSSFGLTVSEAKTEKMCLETKSGGKVSFTINAAGQVYKQTIDFVYLGGAITADRDLSIEITRRLQRAWCALTVEGLLPAGVQPLSDLNGGSSSSSSPPPMQTGFIVVDGPSPADGLGSSPADGLRSFPPSMCGMSEGPLPAGVQPLCSSSSSSSPPPIQAGLTVVDGPSPADGLGSHGSAYTAEMSPESAHTHPGAPSSVCTDTGCTGSSSDGSAAVVVFQQLFTKAPEGTRFAEKRPRRVVLSCLQAGKPSNNLLAQDIQKRRNTFSKKIECQWGVTMQWPQMLNGPKITQAFLAHLTPGSGRQEHPCPREFDNEVTMAEIDDQEEMIRDLLEARVGTREIFKVLEKHGKVLGEEGKSKVRTMKTKCLRAAEKTSDAHAFMTDLHRKGSFVRFATDTQKRTTCVFFATPEQLCLVVVVDKENRTQIACQALVLRERTEDLVFVFECVAEMGKKYPKVIFTDADKAATAAIAQVFPNSLNKYCIFHTIQNIRTHLGGLGSVASKVVAAFQAAAYDLTESDFFGFKRDLLDLLPLGGKAYAYMNDHIFGRFEKWASHVHPGAHTLGMSSTQPVESANSAIKQGLNGASTMMDCLRAITKLNQAWTNTSQKKTVGVSYNRVALGTSNANDAVRDNLLVQVGPFFKKGLREVGASTYAKEVVKSESLATLGYETTVVASDADEARLLLNQFEAEPSSGRLQHSVTINQTTATVSLTACDTEGNSTATSAAVDSTMLPRTPLAHFVDLIRDKSIHQLLRVTPKRGKKSTAGTSSRWGPTGFACAPDSSF
eukprot:jgi/Undpi1/8932/HiC_scaffold_26.g11393.m1